jgi:hypothetical protein
MSVHVSDPSAEVGAELYRHRCDGTSDFPRTAAKILKSDAGLVDFSLGVR